jgi:hypothetical protein
MALPNRYQNTSEPALATYDWRELTTGTAYKTFYAAIESTYDNAIASSSRYYLTENTSNVLSGVIGVSAASPTSADVDFDITFTRPSYIKGTAYIKYSYSKYSNSNYRNFYITFNVYHVDRDTSAESLLGTYTTYNRSSTITNYQEDTCFFEISGQKFKIGDKLRLNAIVVLVNTNVQHIVSLFCNPIGDTITDANAISVTNDLKLILPFKLVSI